VVVCACLDGDTAAWRELVARYERLVFSIPRRYGLSDADCQDVFQNVFAALVRELPRLRDRESLAKWLMTTTHRIAWRQGMVQRPAALAGEAFDPAAPPPDLAVRWERQHLVHEALRRMGGRCEQLLACLYLEDPRPTYEAIARRLELPLGSIGPTRARCMARLLEVMRSMGIERFR
jgi:RNA polymerase sigma factor (sigma-70 family)